MPPLFLRLLAVWTPAIGYGALIIYLSSGDFNIKVKLFSKYDKIAHAVEYFFFAWLWYRAIRSSIPKTHDRWVVPTVLLVSVLFAALDEIYQSINPLRVSDYYDFLADVFGSCAIIMILTVKERLKTLT
jgi:VanZ family protein